MSVQSAVRAGRRAAESLMSTTVSVRRYTGETTMDDLGVETALFDVVYEGKAKIASYEAYESTPDVAGFPRVVVRSRCDFPAGSFAAEAGDEVHVVADSDDPLLAGNVLRLAAPAPFKSHATAYRVPVEEVVNG